MKKGIVVERKRGYMIVVDRQGIFHKAKTVKESEIGAEVIFEEKEGKWSSFLLWSHKRNFRLTAMVILCLSLVTPFFLWSNTNEAYAIVSLDINPSVNIEIDENYRIIDIQPMNEDAKTLLKSIKVENKTLTEVSEEIIQYSHEQLELKNNSPILMAVSYYNDTNNQKQVVQNLEEYYMEKQYPVAIYEVSRSLRTKAEKENISLNKMMAKEIEDERTVVISADNSSNKADESREELPELNEKERELIYNFYYPSQPEQEEASETEESSTKNPTAPSSIKTEVKQSVQNEPVIKTKPALPEQASDVAKENRRKHSVQSKNEHVVDKHAEKKDKADKKHPNKSDKKNDKNKRNKDKGHGPEKSPNHPSNNHPNGKEKK
ncbi:hypothetical protein F9U64_02465 [Gracilibacillus oryzae]|uniref:RsgI N-terminal anti-sigma domain-containing protein n=1 Tax=Gracilibacillus oryzae TaxID=1672701 RepID=A0A7C8GVJ7_9BACI|nr:hypothetical protein [Gracilibacillus oryzae]KAB8138985.1 hypothetical protein F9U64_02465 [Gracilibacillus oryzae]